MTNQPAPLQTAASLTHLQGLINKLEANYHVEWPATHEDSRHPFIIDAYHANTHLARAEGWLQARSKGCEADFTVQPQGMLIVAVLEFVYIAVTVGIMVAGMLKIGNGHVQLPVIVFFVVMLLIIGLGLRAFSQTNNKRKKAAEDLDTQLSQILGSTRMISPNEASV